MQMRSRYTDLKKTSIYVCFTQGVIVKNYIGVISSIENMSHERKFYLHVYVANLGLGAKCFIFPTKFNVMILVVLFIMIIFGTSVDDPLISNIIICVLQLIN